MDRSGRRASAGRSAVPHYDHILVIVEENRSCSTVAGDASVQPMAPLFALTR
jgi:hypothetical protein